MNHEKQVFQASSPVRWHIFKWTSRVGIFALILIIPVIWLALDRDYKPPLPDLKSTQATYEKLAKASPVKALKPAELRKYNGFENFLKAREKMVSLMRKEAGQGNSTQIRAAFYVDWDPQSFFSLQTHISRLNMVIPEWFFIDPATDTLQPRINTDVLHFLKQHNIRILPIVNNINQSLGDGEFDGKMMHRILHDPVKSKRLIDDLIKYLKQYQLQGINVDFEDFIEKKNEPILAFQHSLYRELHRNGFLVTQDIMPDDSDFSPKDLAACNDYLFLMAYDQHYNTSDPGPVGEQKWIEKELDEAAREIPSGKIILSLAGYGYDWPSGSRAQTLTYQQALSLADIHHSQIQFDPDTYNCHFQYADDNGLLHQVYFMDAAGNYNIIRFADEYGTAGTALWRLGSEDDRLWQFYNRNLQNSSVKYNPVDYNLFTRLDINTEKPDYIGDGEILNVVSTPQKGLINIEADSSENLVSEENYSRLPTKYVIRKYGNVQKQVILTFDDGPDETYTPRILDILHQEQVPASFFVVGINAESNLPLLKRIYNEGHEIGNHTFTHPNIAQVSTNRARAEMEATRLLIEAVTGHSTVLFRAPYNADSEPTHAEELKPIALSKINNYYTVGESIDPEDWEPGITADSIYARVVRQYEQNPEKGIILLHDAGGNREATVKALPQIIRYFKTRGVQFTTVANLLNKPKETIMPPVSNSLIAANGKVAGILFALGNFLQYAFWAAIFLGLGKIVLMGIMALVQYRKEKKLKSAAFTPLLDTPVSIIVPAYNEEVNAVRTVQSLLKQTYGNLEVVFVDDGSKDKTLEVVRSAFSGNPRVRILGKANGGKASALNFGISHSNAPILVCIDADTQLMPDAVEKLVMKFTDSTVGAVAGNVKVGNENTLLAKWQSIEYITAQNFDRRAFALINGITVVPGAIGAFRKEALNKAGGFATDTLAEDCDLSIRILKNGFRIMNCTEAIAITEAPETLKQFMKQRFRWSYGIMQSFWKHRDACFNPKFKGLGMVSLPNILLFQVLLPILAPLADVMLVISLVWNWSDPESRQKILLFYLVFQVIDLLVSFIAFRMEKEKPAKLIWLIPQRFIYRQLMYIILFRSLRKIIKGETQGWGILKRTGNARFKVSAG